MNRLSKLAIRFIDWYQWRGGGERLLNVECNFTPTCSEYTRQCIERFGLGRGLLLGWGRIRRCRHRDFPGSINDPLPQHRSFKR